MLIWTSACGGTAWSSLGSLEVDPTPLRMGAGDEATLEGSLVVEAAPAPGRGLIGRLVLSEADGGVVGDAHVVVRAVSAGSALAAGQVDASA